jgi:hypothetical protein
LFNSNIVLETQIEQLNNTTKILNTELEKLRKSKRGAKPEEDFN